MFGMRKKKAKAQLAAAFRATANAQYLALHAKLAQQKQNYGAMAFTCPSTVAIAGPSAILSYRHDVEPLDIPHDGLKLGEIVAWRSWRVRHDFLMSLHVEEAWAPDHAMTGTPLGNGNSNLPGIYAWKESRKALKHMLDTPTAGIMICGSVELWGDRKSVV